MQTYDDFCHLLCAVNTLKHFLNSVSPVGSKANARTICLSLLGVHSTKDGSSLSIVQRRFFMAAIGLNFKGAGGVGKDMWSTKLTSRITIFLLPVMHG